MKALSLILLVGLAGTARADDEPRLMTNLRPTLAGAPRPVDRSQVHGGTMVVHPTPRSAQPVFETGLEVSGLYDPTMLPMVGQGYYFGGAVQPRDLNNDGMPEVRLTGHDLRFVANVGATNASFDLVVAYFQSVQGVPSGSPSGGKLAGVTYATIGPIDLSETGAEYTLSIDLAASFPATHGLLLPGNGVFIEMYFCEPHSVGPGDCNSRLGLTGTYLADRSATPVWLFFDHPGDFRPNYFRIGQADATSSVDNGTDFCSTQIGSSFVPGVALVPATLHSDTLRSPADFNDDGFVDAMDFTDFLATFESGC